MHWSLLYQNPGPMLTRPASPRYGQRSASHYYAFVYFSLQTKIPLETRITNRLSDKSDGLGLEFPTTRLAHEKFFVLSQIPEKLVCDLRHMMFHWPCEGVLLGTNGQRQPYPNPNFRRPNSKLTFIMTHKTPYLYSNITSFRTLLFVLIGNRTLLPI